MNHEADETNCTAMEHFNPKDNEGDNRVAEYLGTVANDMKKSLNENTDASSSSDDESQSGGRSDSPFEGSSWGSSPDL